jgi:uncharacterized phage protein (TIGR01671 family)
MREIKFRAWSNETNEMMTHDDLLKGDGYYLGLSGKLNAIILMQYTGLKDKNGKEIYEGDIIAKKYGDSWANVLVEWDRVGFLSLNNSNEKEVIGDIYQNPELLTKQI